MAELLSQDFIQLINHAEIPAGKKKVLQAAIILFAQDSFNATSTAKIAETAGVSQATIFKYFKNKQALLDDILNMIINELVPQYSQSMLNSMQQNIHNIQGLIHFIVNDRYAFMQTNHNLILIVMSEFLTNDDFVAELVLKLKEKVDCLICIIEEMGEGILLVPGIKLIQLIVSQLLFLFLKEFRLSGNQQLDTDHELAQIEQLVINTVIQK